jgi:hypothetical protein
VLSVEAIAAGAAARWRAGARGPVLLGAVVEALQPARVLEVDGGGAAEVVLGAEPTRAYVAVDSRPERLARTAARAAAARPGVEVACHHARLLAHPRGAPHYTRVAALVETLRGPGFDLIVVAPPRSPEALYFVLALTVPLLRPGGLLHCGPLASDGGVEVARRVAEEGAGPAFVCEPGPGAPRVALVRARAPRRTHEDTRALRDHLVAVDPALGAVLAARDHARACARLRHWLAARLAWSTRDLLLPLAALPPPLAVADVVEQCAAGEGGVWGYGAAVTLAMLYRAFGYPATVYQHGVPGLAWHMMTLVRVPDGRLLLEDAFFDAEPRLGERPATWAEAVTLARAGEAGRLRFVSEARGPRPHLYSRASLAAAEADGYLSAAERARLAASMEGCRRLVGEPRGVLMQSATTSLEAWARIPANARRLAEVERRTGAAGPLGLLGFPCGSLPLTGHAAADREIADLLALVAAEVAPAAAIGAGA